MFLKYVCAKTKKYAFLELSYKIIKFKITGVSYISSIPFFLKNLHVPHHLLHCAKWSRNIWFCGFCYIFTYTRQMLGIIIKCLLGI